ncbi:MAG: hypothetical protein UV41_C0055G0007, partial [Candidatus Daviesbacteria bacterium GW2011_GWA2_42_7]
IIDMDENILYTFINSNNINECNSIKKLYKLNNFNKIIILEVSNNELVPE